MTTKGAAGGGAGFFGRLEALENAAEVRAAFDRYIAPPLSVSQADFFAGLYPKMIAALLTWLELPVGAGGEWREWFPLFQLSRGIDPHYFTAREIERCLAECPPMGAPRRETLLAVLQGFFALRREGFPAGFPSPLLGERETGRWTAIFPAALRWKSLEVLLAVGLYPAGGLEGYRAFKRFAEGRFEPGDGEEGSRGWLRRRGEETKGDFHFRDFLAAAFAGAHGALGLEGFCGAVPRCPWCPLQKDCSWANRRATGAGSAAELLARFGKQEIAALSNAQLLWGLLDLDEAGAKALEEKLGETSLRRLAGKTPRELEEWLEGSGVGREKLLGLFEFCRRYGEEPLIPGVALVSARRVFDHFRLRLRDFKQEQFLAVLLDTKRRFLGEVMISQGTLNSSPVHPREVFGPAVRERAASLIVVHNHPSGDPNPSRDDMEITRRLVTAGQAVGIPLVDHIIVAGDEYFSFVERDLL